MRTKGELELWKKDWYTEIQKGQRKNISVYTDRDRKHKFWRNKWQNQL